MTDAERARTIAVRLFSKPAIWPEDREQLIADIAAVLATVRVESSAEIDQLRQRCAELERERDEAREEVERLTAVTPHTGKEIADLALKWAVVGWMSHSPEMLTAERRKFEHHVLTTFCACARPYKDRAAAAEARLAQAREALEAVKRSGERSYRMSGGVAGFDDIPIGRPAYNQMLDTLNVLATTDTGGSE
jgi:hypothetical protein